MPYIPNTARDPELDSAVEALQELLEERTGGTFNYVLSRLAGGYVSSIARDHALAACWLEHNGPPSQEYQDAYVERYASANYAVRAEVYGHFAAALREYERRVLDAYEAEARRPSKADLPEYVLLDPQVVID